MGTSVCCAHCVDKKQEFSLGPSVAKAKQPQEEKKAPGRSISSLSILKLPDSPVAVLQVTGQLAVKFPHRSHCANPRPLMMKQKSAGIVDPAVMMMERKDLGLSAKRAESLMPVKFMGEQDPSRRKSSPAGVPIDPSQFCLERKRAFADKYEEVAMLGRGSGGVVKKVRDRDTGMFRALKVMSKAGFKPNIDYHEEIEIQKSLVLFRPNTRLRTTRTFCDCVRSTRTSAMSTWSPSNNHIEIAKNRFCEGGDLLSMVAKCMTFTQSNVARIMAQVISAVKYCHKKHIVHRYRLMRDRGRDLKPENIMFLENKMDSCIKVIDFGRSKVLKLDQKIDEVAGSVRCWSHLRM